MDDIFDSEDEDWQCLDCREIFSRNEGFYSCDHNRVNNRYCKQCRNRRSHCAKEYGLTTRDVDNLFKKQRGLCAICLDPLPAGQHTHIDHCHVTGRVRGLLCRGCNLGLGNFKDDTLSLQCAIKYLEKHQVGVLSK